MFLIHWRHVIEPVKIWQGLQIGFVLNEFFGAAVQQPDMRVGSLNHLAVHFQHQTQHPVRRWVLRTKIHRYRFNLHFSHNVLSPYLFYIVT